MQSTTSPADIATLKGLAKEIRRKILKTIYAGGSGHPGGSLSSAEILTVLYFGHMRHNSKDPKWADRDRFVMSKGHASPVVYATLAQAGYFPEEELPTFRKINSRLQGHTHIMVPGVEMDAGSLGQGLSFGVGTALAARLDSRPTRTFTLMGDGENQEGSVWEAAMSAAHYKLDNLVAIIDRNRIQNDRFVIEVMDIDPLPEKWRAFGWNVEEIDGHDVAQVVGALERAAGVKGKPSCIIAHTAKGKGVSFMENNPDFHGRAPTKDEFEKAMAELA